MTTFTRTLHAGGFLLGALSGAAAHAGPPATYVFTVHHLELLGVPATDPNRYYDVSGVFTGSDANHNGTLSIDELTSFIVGTNPNPVGGPYQLLPSVKTPYFSLGCIPEPDPEVCRRWSTLLSFNYTLGSNSLQAWGAYPRGDNEAFLFSMPNGYFSEGVASSSTELDWNPGTWTSVRPIPEPPTAVLAVLGLAAAWRRRAWRTSAVCAGRGPLTP